VRGGPGRRSDRAALDAAFARIDQALERASRRQEDCSAAAALPALIGPWAKRAAAIHALVSGRPLSEVSLHDFPSMEYSDNRFIAGGFGSYVARLAARLPIRLGAAVRRIDWSGRGVRVETDAGTIAAKAAVVTVPVALLQRDAVRFSPELPDETAAAIAAFRPGTYEHVVLHWPGAPFRNPDELATIVGGRRDPPGFLARIDGTPFHYLELDHTAVNTIEGRGPDAARQLARTILREHFGNRALADLSIPAVTDWRHDLLARGSWAVVPPGEASARLKLRRPVADRLWFAGEALSREQWGTVGGAWEEGERAAQAIARTLAAPPH
jgi:monoamine oxidase